jgi:hypothetical protein
MSRATNEQNPVAYKPQINAAVLKRVTSVKLHNPAILFLSSSMVVFV